MPKVDFVEHEGTRHTVEVPIGQNLKQAALDNLIPGIIGDCGGCLECGTCHAYIEEPFLAKLPPPSEDETIILEGVPAPLQDNSRLTCQVVMSESLDGMEVALPETQV